MDIQTPDYFVGTSKNIKMPKHPRALHGDGTPLYIINLETRETATLKQCYMLGYVPMYNNVPGKGMRNCVKCNRETTFTQNDEPICPICCGIWSDKEKKEAERIDKEKRLIRWKQYFRYHHTTTHPGKKGHSTYISALSYVENRGKFNIDDLKYESVLKIINKNLDTFEEIDFESLERIVKAK